MGNFTDSLAWKTFIIKFGGIAAAVVIVGALFKIQHWPGAGIMITVGMSSEVIIFLLSALDTFHPDVDWSVVYPELKHEEGPHTEVVLESDNAPIAAVGADHKREVLQIAKEKSKVKLTPEPESVPQVVAPNIDLSALNVDTAAISTGVKKFGESIGKLNAFSDAVSSANVLADKLQKASSTVNDFTDAYGNSTKALSESADGLVTSYKSASEGVANVGKQAGEIVMASGKKMSQVVEESTNTLAASYQTVSDNINNLGKQAGESVAISGKLLSQVMSSATDSFAETFTLIDQHIKQNLSELKHGNTNYNKSVEALNKNMSALNATYELQVQEAVKYQKKSSDIGQYMENFVEDLKKSAIENQDFRKELSHLNQHIADLNTIYGSMLSAVQMVTKKK
ncbi:hypothetical protein FACS189467_7420 [Bacteroidia bacterium]|nr:hypothetical protein FACS189467_7420 [Bacteroidia bacterium]